MECPRLIRFIHRINVNCVTDERGKGEQSWELHVRLNGLTYSVKPVSQYLPDISNVPNMAVNYE